MHFDPKDIVEQLRHNLERYPYGDGFPVLRELLQNADDARAEAVTLHLLAGWPEARNPLLQGPGLLLVNDGGFDERSARGMQTFGGSVKALDEAAVGRFGLGQKSVFHLCDAFIVVPDGYGAHAPFVVNPFEMLGRPGDACLDWREVESADARRIAEAGARSLPGRRRLNLWFPLRRQGLRPKPKSNGIVGTDIAPESLAPLADRWRLAELLAALRHVRRLTVALGGEKAELDRGDAPRPVGYSLAPGERSFGGPLGPGLSSHGRERRAEDGFRRDLRQSPHWPRTRNRDTDEEEPQKATPHGAVILVQDTEGTAGLSADWAVLLPVAAALPAVRHAGEGGLRLLLQGCFFVDSGRKAVIGLDAAEGSAGAGADEHGIRAAWNRALRDELVLPLIPAVLHEAWEAGMLSPATLAGTVAALAASTFGRAHRRAISAEQALARVAERTGKGAVARWRLLPAGGRLRPLPAPDEAGRIAAADILPGLVDRAEASDVALVCGPGAVLSVEPPEWEAEELAEALGGLSASVFQAESRARVLADLLAVACSNAALREAAAGPVLGRLAEALASERALAPHEKIGAVLAAIDCGATLPLPPAASERIILRALAGACPAPLCLPRDWLPPGAGAGRTLDVRTARRLIGALQPLLQTDRQSDAAAAAALALLRRLTDPRAAVADPQLSRLKVLRASGGAGPQLLSLADLDAAARERRLFRDSPAAQARLKRLAAALPDISAFILPGGVAKALEEDGGGAPLFPTADLDAAAACALVRSAAAFGPAEARAGLLADIFTTEAGARGALRALAAGDPRAQRDEVRLLALSETAPALDAFLARLIAGAEGEIPVPGEILDRLDRGKQRQLGIARLEGEELGALLARHAGEFAAAGLDTAVAEAILGSEIPDAALSRLPVLPRAGGGWAVAERLHRKNPDWPLPPALTPLVAMLGEIGNPKERARAERLVRLWSPEAQISVCLDVPEPARFAAEILAALDRGGAPPDPERLRQLPWLADRRGRAWRPEDVLDLPEEVLAAARKVLGADLPFLPASDLAPALREATGFDALRRFNLLPDEAGSLERLLDIIEKRRPVAYMGEATEDLAAALAALAREGAELPLPGWPLLAAVLRMQDPGGQPDGVSLRHRLRCFDSCDPAARGAAIGWLNALARRAETRGGEKADGPERRAYAEGFKAVAACPRDLFRSIAAELLVPTKDGGWRRGSEVAAVEDGVAAAYALLPELIRVLPAHPEAETDFSAVTAACSASDDRGPRQRGEDPAALQPIVQRLLQYFPPEYVAFFVLALGSGTRYRAQAAVTGIGDRKLEEMRTAIARIIEQAEAGLDPWLRTVQHKIRETTLLRFHLVSAGPIAVNSLAGNRITVPGDFSRQFAIVGDGHLRENLRRTQSGLFQAEVFVSDTGGEIRAEQVEALLRVVRNKTLSFRFDHTEPFVEELRRQLRVDQSSVEDARARLEDRLPQILAELKPPPGSPLREALDDYERKEQALPPDRRAGALPKAKRDLWSDVASRGADKLLGLIRAGIERYGYGPSRILFELFQNADDAALQHPPEGTPACRIDRAEGRLRFVHWGRLVNHLGADPAAGERSGWQRDLFNMLLMSLSEKRAEVTGRFGLGFKSVHLIAREVGIASGFVACRIRGGMLPEVWDEGRAISLEQARGGRRATVIDLEIDPQRAHAAREAQESFAKAARWLPATAQAIREIVLDGRRHAARFTESGAPGILHVALEGVAPGHALALSLDPDTTLFLPLGPDGPEPLPEGVPRLWLLAPLEEECQAGWLMNSYGFRVDPGRGRLAGESAERKALFEGLGRALGDRLVALHDRLETDWAGFAAAAGLADRDPETGPAAFRDRLVRVFALDLARDARDDRLETHLHREGGLRQLLAARPALPTGLPAPFAPFLRADRVRWQVTGPLAEPARLRRLAGWSVLAGIADTSVSAKAAELLARLGFDPPPAFGVADLLGGELDRTRGRADPATAARLRALLDEDLEKALPWNERQTLGQAAAGALFRMADGSWRKAQLPPRAAADADEEERRILDFAPDAAVADARYVGAALAFHRLAARQSGFQQRADTFARWAEDMADPTRQHALLAYVLEGRQGAALGDRLSRERPHWLPATAEALRTSPLLEGFDDEARGKLMTLLYPDLARSISSGRLLDFLQIEETGEAAPDPAAELARIRDWWHRDHARERADYDRRIWPEGFRPGRLRDAEAADDRLGWFTFFALGIFRTLGWNNEGAHRSFVEDALRAGWWQEMATARLPEDPKPWLARLEAFARADAWRIDFPQWRRAMVDLYALARWLPDYAEAFRLLPEAVARRGPIALSDAWRISASPLWARRGLEGAPLTQSLGLGANWMIREAVRHGFWSPGEAERMHPYGWAATERLRRLFDESFGYRLEDRGGMDLSPDIHRFVARHLGPDAAFLGDLDLPLQLRADKGLSPDADAEGDDA